jgi:phosphate transport system permease protein
MTESTASSRSVREKVRARQGKRYSAERRFRLLGVTSIVIAVSALLLLLGSMIVKGASAFVQTHLLLEITLPAEELAPNGKPDAKAMADANYTAFIRRALAKKFSDVRSRRDKRSLYKLISEGASIRLQKLVAASPDMIGTTVPFAAKASDDVDQYFKGKLPKGQTGRLSAKQTKWVETLREAGEIETRFNTAFFTNGDSREPELAGIWGAMMGSLLAMAVTLVLSFPLGVAAAIYLEEFAPRNRWTDLIEVNINNLAAVPSIVFGLLGLAVFLNFFGMLRSAPLVGGMVLALMTLPTVIIAGRAALGAVPPSIREAALGVGASPMQVVLHHVLPLAMPGILTGTIIGAARALGETAPLLMIGMVAFIVDIPGSITDPATALPVQIFLWADSPERAFVERTAAATLVLLAFLIVMNLLAVILRKRFERRW